MEEKTEKEEKVILIWSSEVRIEIPNQIWMKSPAIKWKKKCSNIPERMGKMDFWNFYNS